MGIGVGAGGMLTGGAPLGGALGALGGRAAGDLEGVFRLFGFAGMWGSPCASV
jgi:hypothetical protein